MSNLFLLPLLVAFLEWYFCTHFLRMACISHSKDADCACSIKPKYKLPFIHCRPGFKYRFRPVSNGCPRLAVVIQHAAAADPKQYHLCSKLFYMLASLNTPPLDIPNDFIYSQCLHSFENHVLVVFC